MSADHQTTQELLASWVNALARPAIVKMRAYQSARSQMTSGSARIYMDANELAASSTPELARYPDPQPAQLQRLVTALFKVPASNLFLGAGVDDAIDALLRVFCEAKYDSILITPPTYGYYAVAADIQGAEVISASLKAETFDLDEGAILRSLRPNTKLVFVCNPNNPTGNGFDSKRLFALAKTLERQALLVVDEAYIEFSGRPSLLAESERPGNLVILRTFSKAWGLAGARLGMAVADESVIALLHKVRAPYPIARPQVAAAMAELGELSADVLADRIKSVNAERDQLMRRLGELPFVQKVYPSESNFILAKVDDAPSVMQRCADSGIIIRDRSKEPGLANCVRITVGTAAENAALLSALAPGGAR